MEIWQSHDTDGEGVDAEVLTVVIREMLQQGLIRMTVTGRVLAKVPTAHHFA